MYLVIGGHEVDFVRIPRKIVELETGARIEVQPFAMSKRCVTVGLYRAFQEATKYVTVAEKNGQKVRVGTKGLQLEGKLYYDNELIEHLPPEERLTEPAFCMSYVDAMSLCEWAQVYLPTEAQWLAGSLIDDRVYDIEGGEECPWYDKKARRSSAMLEKLENALVQAQLELTATLTDDGRVVVRGEPWYFRRPDWRSTQGSPYLVGPDQWGLLISFRVCTEVK
jgi:hypothetical protein